MVVALRRGAKIGVDCNTTTLRQRMETHRFPRSNNLGSRTTICSTSYTRALEKTGN